MQYFTPELFARLQDLTDRAALKEWDRAAERYSASLKQVWSRLPAAVQKLASLPFLHDAEVLCIAQSRGNVSITLDPEADDGRLIVLLYTLVEDPRINRSAIPDRYRTEYVAWLYDEIGVGEPVNRQPSWRSNATTPDGRVPVYDHHILLSNGWELSLRFRQVKITCPQRVLPSVPADDNASPGFSRSA